MKASWMTHTRIMLAALVLAALSTRFAPVAQAETPTPLYEPGQVIVRLNTAAGATIGGLNMSYGTRTLDRLLGHPDIFLLATPLGTDPLQMSRQLMNDPLVGYAEPNYTHGAPDFRTDRTYAWGGQDGSQWEAQSISTVLGLGTAHQYARGAGTIIAVLDTGVQLDHPALQPHLTLLGYDFVSNDAVASDEGNGRDDDGDGLVDEALGHGTHVAGIAHLVAPESKILPVRVLNSDGRGNSFRTANAMRYAANSGADVINLSLGTASRSRLMRDVLNEVSQSGVLVVAAAGNENGTTRQYPGAEACALSVTSVNGQNHKSSFASYGDWVDIATPGENIYSAVPINSYAWWSGTSMATPILAGHAALLRSYAGGLTIHEIGTLIGGTVTELNSGNPEYRNMLGAGRIDIPRSFSALAANRFPAASTNLLADCR